MNLEITNEQAQRLEVCRQAFNQFTGQSFTLQQYAAFVLSDAIAGEERAAANVEAVRYAVH